MKAKTCPQCKTGLRRVQFDVGYGVEVESLHCRKCGFNITANNALKKALHSLRKQMSKEVKIIQVGTGLGIRFPNNVVKSYNLKKGEDIILKPEGDGVKLVTV